ncbi:50S ribosomal protein L1 [Candidatus Micrarchaeota archaeon]|nr:50S ribosomal protein L1 [Candidatus Micrarchaeota archaeon]
MVDKKKVEAAVKTALAEKGERKFKQSLELAVNFKDLDFKKPENRLNLDVILPVAPRKVKIAVFADTQLALDAKNAGADLVISGEQIKMYASDKKKQKELLEYRFLAAPQLMVEVGKSLGQVLGTRGLLPKPIPPGSNLKALIENARRTVNVKTKGKYLPTIHVIFGNEELPVEQLSDNAFSLLESIENKVGQPAVRSVFVKSTMGKPVRVSN